LPLHNRLVSLVKIVNAMVKEAAVAQVVNEEEDVVVPVVVGMAAVHNSNVVDHPGQGDNEVDHRGDNAVDLREGNNNNVVVADQVAQVLPSRAVVSLWAPPTRNISKMVGMMAQKCAQFEKKVIWFRQQYL
jgi:hypothetical protein